MESYMLIMGTVLVMLLYGASCAADIALKLVMPGTIFWPGTPCGLDLNVNNTGEALTGAELYVALTLGTGDFWFYPSWAHYPPEIDFAVVDLGQTEATLPIIPEFIWPEGCGLNYDAMFYAAVMNGGNLVSNLAEYTFGWSEPGAMYSTADIAGNMRFVPLGSFFQGSAPFSDDNPCPQADNMLFTHSLTNNIIVMETEVTRQMWSDLRATQSTLPEDPSETWASPFMNDPVQHNTWNESVLFANLLSLHNGLSQCYFKDAAFTIPVDATNYITGYFFCNFTTTGYRLPSEGEWEYFCRAGTTTPFSCNETNNLYENCYSCSAGTLPTLERYCVYCANAPSSTAQPVGNRLPNPWHLYDVHGNVFEWCWDWYGIYPSGAQTNYSGPGTGSDRVIRGGSWGNPAAHCCSAFRGGTQPANRHRCLGFRLVRTLP